MRAIFRNPTRARMIVNDVFGRLIYKLSAYESIDLTPYIGEVNSLDEAMSRIVVNNHFDAVIRNKIRGVNIPGANFLTLQSDVSAAKAKITMTFTGSTTSALTDWNSFFGAENTDTPFDTMEVVGNSVTLSGPTTLTLKENLFRGTYYEIFGLNEDSGEMEVMSTGYYDNLGIVSFTDEGVCSIINNYAFKNCKELTSVVSIKATTIKNNVFENCVKLTGVTLPATATIGESAFITCSNLVDATFPLAITVGSRAFLNCSSLTGATFTSAISIGVTTAFYGCSSLVKVSFPSLTAVSYCSFLDCVKLTGAAFPSAVIIAESAFENCPELTEAIFPVATTIADAAFKKCSSLTEMKFPSCTALGTTTGDNGVFNSIVSNTINLTIPHALETDGDVAYLAANNTVNIINP